MADTPWRGTPEFETAVKEWARESGLPIEEARTQLDDMYRAAPEFGPSKVVKGPTPHGWRGAIERSLRGDQRVDLGDLFDELAEEGIDIEKELADWKDEPLHTKAESEALSKDRAARLKEGKPPRIYDYDTRALFDPETNEWTGTMDELLDELDEGISDIDDQQRTARLKDIEEAAKRQSLKKPTTPDWASRMPDRLSDISGAQEPLPPSMEQYMKGPIERSLRKSAGRVATPMSTPSTVPGTAVPSFVTDLKGMLKKGSITPGEFEGAVLQEYRKALGAADDEIVVFRGTKSGGIQAVDSLTDKGQARITSLWEQARKLPGGHDELPPHLQQELADLHIKQMRGQGQFFSGNYNVASHYAGDVGEITAVKLPKRGLAHYFGDAVTPANLGGGATYTENYVIPSDELLEMQNQGRVVGPEIRRGVSAAEFEKLTGQKRLTTPKRLASQVKHGAGKIATGVARGAPAVARSAGAGAAASLSPLALVAEAIPMRMPTGWGPPLMATAGQGMLGGSPSDLYEEHKAARQEKAREEESWRTTTPDTRQMSLPEKLRYEKFQEKESSSDQPLYRSPIAELSKPARTSPNSYFSTQTAEQ